MKKKNMAMIMAGVTVATSVAPAFAAQTNEEVKKDQNYKINAKDTAKLVEEVRKALDVKFTGTEESVYSIKVGETQIVNATDLQNKIGALSDGSTLTVEIQDKGHKTVDGKIVGTEVQTYKNVAEIVEDIKNENIAREEAATEDTPAVTLNVVTKPGNIVEVTKGDDTTSVVTVKVGDNKLNFAEEKIKEDKLVGFEEAEAADIESGIKHIIAIKKTDAEMKSVEVDTLFDGMRLSLDGMKLVELVKADKDNTTIGNLGLISLATGETSFEVTLKDAKTGKESQVITISGKADLVVNFRDILKGEAQASIETIAGDDRFETSIKVSQKSFGAGDADAVVLIGKNAVVDGLAAAPLAAEKNAPILLSNVDGLIEEVETEMLRVLGDDLAGKTIYIVGGVNQISKDAEAELAKLGAKIDRVSGDDRYETSLAIAKRVAYMPMTELVPASEKAATVKPKTAFVVGGNGEVDAMSIAAYAAQTKSPIIVTNANEVSEKTEKFLSNEDLINEIVVVGGKSSVSEAVVEKLDSLDEVKNNVERLAGDDRQGTNAAVINKYYKNVEKVYVAKDGYGTGVSHLIDALTAAPLAGEQQAPIVLATNNLSTKQAEAVQIAKGTSTSIIQIGQGIAKTVVEKLSKVLN